MIFARGNAGLSNAFLIATGFLVAISVHQVRGESVRKKTDEPPASRVAVTTDPLPAISIPLRMDDLDGPVILRYRKRGYHPPLLYPGKYDPFARIDGGDPSFRSLEELIANPELAPPRPKPPKAWGMVPVPGAVGRGKDASLATLATAREVALERRLRTLEERLLNAGEGSVANVLDSEVEAFANEGKARDDLERKLEHLEALLEKSGIEVPSEELAPVPPPTVAKTLGLRPLTVPVPPAPEASPSLSPVGDLPVTPVSPSPLSSQAPSGAVLKMKAMVPLPQGGTRPALASEIFITTKGLNELLQEVRVSDDLVAQTSSLLELWAQSVKERGSSPDAVSFDVDAVLIKAQVSKLRTDFRGEGMVAGLRPDDYYLIGIEKDDETGIVTIWSKKVKVSPGENVIELSASDVVWPK